jgi:hypothetical protein
MKSIINGLRYNTANAIEIGSADYGNWGDFARWEACLYKTPRSGRYFLAGSGGPMTRWARRNDANTYGSGSGIIPFDDVEDAREWAEQHLTTDEVEAGFASIIVDA